MSARLSVVLCQSSSGSPACRDVEGDLVARLIGSPGLDMSLIGSLDNFDPSGTDRLLLDGLSGDVAILSWHNPADGFQLCHTIGLSGFRAQHSLDPEGSQQPPSATRSGPINLPVVGNGSVKNPKPDARRLYFFNLAAGSAEQIVVGLQQILHAKQPHAAAPAKRVQSLAPLEPFPSNTTEPASKSPASGVRPTPQRRPIDLGDSTEWDSLVEELNDLDI